MRHFFTIINIILLTLFSFYAHAEDKSEPAKLKFRPTGRILIDGALFIPDNNTFVDGVAMPDIRLGGIAAYRNFLAKIDIGYGSGKLSMKDVYIAYSPNEENLFQLGYFVHQFGLNASTSSSTKPTMIQTTSDNFFGATRRNFGFMYRLNKGNYFLGTSLYTSAGSILNSPREHGKINVGVMERFVWRPFHSFGNIIQVGFSSCYSSAKHTSIEDEEGNRQTSPGFLDYSAPFPTQVNNIPMLSADVQNARGVVKLTPEILLSKNRFAVESQYYYMNVFRNMNLAPYTAYGTYVSFRTLILGDKRYSYSSSVAGLAIPAPKTLECVLNFDYTNACCSKADILGGIAKDYSLTFNYYLNKYITFRLRYSFTDFRGSSVQPDRKENIIQARAMFLF